MVEFCCESSGEERFGRFGLASFPSKKIEDFNFLKVGLACFANYQTELLLMIG